MYDRASVCAQTSVSVFCTELHQSGRPDASTEQLIKMVQASVREPVISASCSLFSVL